MPPHGRFLPSLADADGIQVDIHRSEPPCPPGRVLKKYSARPSADRQGLTSLYSVFPGGPRLTAAPKGPVATSRLQAQVS